MYAAPFYIQCATTNTHSQQLILPQTWYLQPKGFRHWSGIEPPGIPLQGLHVRSVVLPRYIFPC